MTTQSAEPSDCRKKHPSAPHNSRTSGILCQLSFPSRRRIPDKNYTASLLKPVLAPGSHSWFCATPLGGLLGAAESRHASGLLSPHHGHWGGCFHARATAHCYTDEGVFIWRPRDTASVSHIQVRRGIYMEYTLDENHWELQIVKIKSMSEKISSPRTSQLWGPNNVISDYI